MIARPKAQRLGRRVRFHRNLLETGRIPARRILGIESRAADRREAEAPRRPAGAPVHVCEGLPLADNVLIAVFRSVLPADRLPAIVAKTPSVTEALGRAGVTDYRRAATRVTATAASATQAHYHGLADGAPLLRMVSVNVDGDGHPVEYGRTWFASERLTLTVGPE